MTDSSAEPPASPWRRRTLVVLFLLFYVYRILTWKPRGEQPAE